MLTGDPCVRKHQTTNDEQKNTDDKQKNLKRAVITRLLLWLKEFLFKNLLLCLDHLKCLPLVTGQYINFGCISHISLCLYLTIVIRRVAIYSTAVALV